MGELCKVLIIAGRVGLVRVVAGSGSHARVALLPASLSLGYSTASEGNVAVAFDSLSATK